MCWEEFYTDRAENDKYSWNLYSFCDKDRAADCPPVLAIIGLGILLAEIASAARSGSRRREAGELKLL
jgi:hypothetical protein